ncbi:hypothetical protein MYX76_16355 [Desulfobacterota bacterium AH_259_B03_O07]|nr:hypothetical protein [Desulfobacterota bacterium AH_259_B03_O07]
MKKLLLSLGLLLSLSLSLTGCNDDNAKAQGDAEVEIDFLIDVISGVVLENSEGDGFILELKVSPIAVFIEERPGGGSGSINIEEYLENFNEIIGDVPPNAILHNLTDGKLEAFPMKLNSVLFDTSKSLAEFLVTPLVHSTSLSPPEAPEEINNVPVIPTPITQALLFIDDAQPPCNNSCPDCRTCYRDAVPPCCGFNICKCDDPSGLCRDTSRCRSQ